MIFWSCVPKPIRSWPIGASKKKPRATTAWIKDDSIVNMPTRVKHKLDTINKLTPRFVFRFLFVYSWTPKEKIRFKKPPTTTVLLKRVETSPTPRSLIAFSCQLNQGDCQVAYRTITMIRNEDKIPQIPPRRRIVKFFGDCLITVFVLECIFKNLV